jgi:integrase
MQQIRKKTEMPSTINHYISFLRAMYVWAYSADLVENRLDKLQKVRDDRKSRIEDKYLEPAELEKLLKEIKNEKYRAFTQFLALTGLRIGEAAALTMADLDEYIHVTKTYNVQLRTVMSTPKTSASTRDVFIQPELAEFLHQYKLDRLQWQLVEGVKTDLLFFGKGGGHLRAHSYAVALAKASAAIGHRISPHALRHTHASILAAQGVSYDAIARRLGHERDTITKEVYLHVTQKLRELDNEAMKDVHIL